MKPKNTQEVTDALQKRDIDDLNKAVTSLVTAMENGFKGVHERQDKTNGNVINLKIWRAYITGAIAVLTGLILPIVFIIVSNYIQTAGK